MMLQAVVFDLDDTLYPEHEFVHSGFLAVSQWAERHLRIPASSGLARLEALFADNVRERTFDRWLEEAGHEPTNHVAQLVHVYRRHIPDIAPYPGVPALLARLRVRYRLGLISDGHAATQRNKLTALGLQPYFHSVVFSDDWGRDAWKPAALPYRTTLTRLRVSAGATVYIADNPAKDFFGARRVGMKTIRLRVVGGVYSMSEPETPEHAADTDITALADLTAAMARLGRTTS